MESLQLTCFLSCKPCAKPGSSLGVRPFRQVGFGSLWRNKARSGCLMAKSSVNIGGGGGKSGGYYGGGSGTHEWSSGVEVERDEEIHLGAGGDVSSFDNIGFNLSPPPSEMSSGNGEIGEPNKINVGEGKNKLVEDQLKEIYEEIRKNNDEIKKLTKTVQSSWDVLREEVRNNGVSTRSSFHDLALQLMEKTRNDHANTHKNATAGSEQSNQSQPTPQNNDNATQNGYENTVHDTNNFKKRRRYWR